MMYSILPLVLSGTFVCSNHFPLGRRTPENPKTDYPSIFMTVSDYLQKRLPKKRKANKLQEAGPSRCCSPTSKSVMMIVRKLMKKWKSIWTTSQSRGELWEIIQLHLCTRFLACELMYFLQKAKFNTFVSIKHRFNPRHDEKSYVFHLIFVSRSQHNFAVRFQFVLGKGNQCCACLFSGGGDPRLRLL